MSDDFKLVQATGKEMAVQDNRSTQYVMFVIQVDFKNYHEGGEFKERKDPDWMDADDLCPSCKALYEDGKGLPVECDNWQCLDSFASYDEDERFDLTAGVFLTANACEQHIAENHYHYNNPRSYGIAAWRNPEMQAVMRSVIKAGDQEVPSHYA